MTSLDTPHFFPLGTRNRRNGTGLLDLFGATFLKSASDFQADFETVTSLKYLTVSIASLARSIHPEEE